MAGIFYKCYAERTGRTKAISGGGVVELLGQKILVLSIFATYD